MGHRLALMTQLACGTEAYELMFYTPVYNLIERPTTSSCAYKDASGRMLRVPSLWAGCA